MELRIALPIARIYHARGLTQIQTQTQLMLDGAEPWVARFAARNAAHCSASNRKADPVDAQDRHTAEQLARRNAQQLTTPFLAGDDVLVYFDSRWYPAEVHSVEREVVAGHVVAVYVTGFQGRAEAIRFDHVDVVVR